MGTLFPDSGLAKRTQIGVKSYYHVLRRGMEPVDCNLSSVLRRRLAFFLVLFKHLSHVFVLYIFVFIIKGTEKKFSYRFKKTLKFDSIRCHHSTSEYGARQEECVTTFIFDLCLFVRYNNNKVGYLFKDEISDYIMGSVVILTHTHHRSDLNARAEIPRRFSDTLNSSLSTHY